jgi:hypothetical protein
MTSPLPRPVTVPGLVPITFGAGSAVGDPHLRLQIEVRAQGLTAARAANRELMTQLNANRPTH